MKTKSKCCKLTSFLMALVMVISLIPVMGTKVSAATAPADGITILEGRYRIIYENGGSRRYVVNDVIGQFGAIRALEDESEKPWIIKLCEGENGKGYYKLTYQPDQNYIMDIQYDSSHLACNTEGNPINNYAQLLKPENANAVLGTKTYTETFSFLFYQGSEYAQTNGIYQNVNIRVEDQQSYLGVDEDRVVEGKNYRIFEYPNADGNNKRFILSPVTYTVNFDSATGQTSSQKIIFDYPEGIALANNTFTREGCEFARWKDKNDGSKTYENGQKVKNLATAENETINLLAVWKFTKPEGVSAEFASSESASDGSLSGMDDTMEYSINDGTTWIPVGSGKTDVENLPKGDVLVRRAGKDDIEPSDPVTKTIGVKTDQNKPDESKLKGNDASGEDKKDGSIEGVDDTMEYSTDDGKTWTDVPKGETKIEGLGKGDVLVRYGETDEKNPSEPVKVTIGAKKDGGNGGDGQGSDQDPKADDFKVTDASGEEFADGSISGVNDKMEYSTDGQKTWTRVPKGQTTIENIPAGTIVYIRYVQTDTQKASGAVQLNVGTAEKKNNLTINKGLKIDQKKSEIRIKWGKVPKADGYQVYVAYCSTKFKKKPTKTIKGNKVTSVKIKKIGGKKLDLKKNFKVYIVAYKNKDGKKVRIAKTITGHVVGRKNKAYTNAKNIKLTKKKYSIKVGKKAKIKAKTILVDKKKKQLTDAHAKEFRYESTDKSIATVSKKGKVKGVSKGTCKIYVYSRNGYAKAATVTVK